MKRKENPDAVAPKEKKHKSLYAKVKRRLENIRIVFNILFIILYTLFTIVMLRRSWGNTVYISIILGFIVLYVLLFALLMVLTRKNTKKFNRSIKDYKSGLKILKAFLTVISFGLSVSLFAGAAWSGITSTPFQMLVLTVSLLWALFQIFFQFSKILKRHGVIKKKKDRLNKKKKGTIIHK